MVILLGLILLVLLAGFGFISRSVIVAIKLTFMAGVAAGLLLMIWLMALGTKSTPGIVFASFLTLLLGGAVLAGVRAVILTDRARRNPARYSFTDLSCGECHRMLMKDPMSFDDKEPYTHLFKPETPHKVVLVHEVPEWLPEGMAT